MESHETSADTLSADKIREAVNAQGSGPQRFSVLQAQIAAIRRQALAAAEMGRATTEMNHAVAVQCDAFLLMLAMLNVGGAMPPAIPGAGPASSTEPPQVFGGKRAGESG